MRPSRYPAGSNGLPAGPSCFCQNPYFCIQKHLPEQPIDILRRYWGYEQFRPLQEEIIRSLLDGRDTLALMPTGGGKSICFQVPALLREGICIVVSPLIALMKDQVQQLQRRNIPAVAVHSGMPYREIDRLIDNCVYGNIKFLYLSPERLRTDLARERIGRMNVSFIAVDEAHCVSQWGYDFRPAYLEIAQIREWLPKPPLAALTATATPQVVIDIQDKLSFRHPHVLQKSFYRSNLSYSVLYEEGKEAKLVDILRKVPGTGIVYARNRRRTVELAQLLRRQGIRADYYHAGLDPQERSQKQEQWITGQSRIMVSTNAFGMGIDKADVRTVVHMELPDSLEAYFQEAGRAGRDGKKAYAVLLYHENDRRQLRRRFERSYPDMQIVRRVYRALGSFYQLATGAGKGRSYDFDIIVFSQTYRLEVVDTFHALRLLEQAGWISLTDAVFQPASLRIKVTKDELYDYQLRHPKLDRVLKAVLRTYQGAFSHYLHIRESQLANSLKISREELRSAFEKLAQDHIIDYAPQKERPQLIFLQERVQADNLTIDHELFEFRKKRHRERIEAAIGYAETITCRSRQLLAYFGENTSEACGICDVCTGRNIAVLQREDLKKLEPKIRLLLIRDQLTLEETLESFSPKWRERVLQALEYLIDEGFIAREDNRLSWRR